MKILLWNTEWASPQSPAGIYLQNFAESTRANIICYTEVRSGLHPKSGHLIESNPDYGYQKTEGKRKVSLWSSSPWERVDTIGLGTLPGGRYISGISHGIRFIGVCIPWRDAHVRTGQKNRGPWEDHISYLVGLKEILADYKKKKYPICILGDYNQRIPRNRQPKHVYEHLVDVLSADLKTETSEKLDPEGKPLIDHISVSPELSVSIEEIHPKTTEDNITLSDHVGIVASIEVC